MFQRDLLITILSAPWSNKNLASSTDLTLPEIANGTFNSLTRLSIKFRYSWLIFLSVQTSNTSSKLEYSTWGVVYKCSELNDLV